MGYVSYQEGKCFFKESHSNWFKLNLGILFFEMTFFFCGREGFQILAFLGLGGIPSQVSQVFLVTLPETHIFAPENGW